MGLVYQNTGHGTQDRVPNVIPRTVYCLLYMGTRGPGLQMEARNITYLLMSTVMVAAITELMIVR